MCASITYDYNYNPPSIDERLRQRKYSNQKTYLSNMDNNRGNPDILSDPNDIYFDKRSALSVKSPSIKSNMSQNRPKYMNQPSIDLQSPTERRMSAISNGYVNNDQFHTNSNELVPMVAKSSTTPRPFSGVSKLLKSMRRGKSQTNLNQLGSTKELNKSQPDLKSSSLNLGSKFNLFGGSQANLDSPTNHSAKVIHLDGQEQSIQINKSNVLGSDIFNMACEHANILEVDYFGLTYKRSSSIWFWLESDRKVSKQLSNQDEWKFFFQVKFYPPEPSLLLEDITRFYLVLQIRQDIASGKLPCSWVTQALLSSYLLQSELGNFDENNQISLDELRSFQFVKNANDPLLKKIIDLHKSHTGLRPAQADLKYLETAKRLERYGIDLHPARDMENIMIDIGVGYQGILIYRDKRRIGRFAWPKVLQLSYEKSDFFLTIRPDDIDSVETKIGFRLYNNHLAKRLWKSAVDHHSFFRLKQPQQNSRKLTLSRNFGSQHYLSGRTFHQNRTMTINRPNPDFDRTLLRKKTSSMPMGLDASHDVHRNMSEVHGSEMNSYSQANQNRSNNANQYYQNNRNDPIMRPNDDFENPRSPAYQNDGLEDGSYIGGGSMMSGLSEQRRNFMDTRKLSASSKNQPNPNEIYNEPRSINRDDISYVNNNPRMRNHPKAPSSIGSSRAPQMRPSNRQYSYNNYQHDDDPNYL